MSDFLKRDPRIEEGTALRDLEKKVHYLLQMMSDAGLAVDHTGNPWGSPDDLENWEIFADSQEVKNSK